MKGRDDQMALTFRDGRRRITFRGDAYESPDGCQDSAALGELLAELLAALGPSRPAVVLACALQDLVECGAESVRLPTSSGSDGLAVDRVSAGLAAFYQAALEVVESYDDLDRERGAG